jgi:hypothetical protein
MSRRNRAYALIAVLAGVAGVWASYEVFIRARDRNVEAYYKPLLPERYSDFRVIFDDADFDLTVFAYRPMLSAQETSLLEATIRRIEAHEPGYRRVFVGQREGQLRLGIKGKRSFKEYRVAVDSGRGRIVILNGFFTEESEFRQYDTIVHDFRRRAGLEE